MRLILSRHGNTFGPNDRVVWAGSANDLPLVESGVMQAKKLAQFLSHTETLPTAIYCGPLQRTSHYARIVTEQLRLPLQPIVDHRLNEIDYGKWTGLSNAEVTQLYGDAPLEAWENKSEWPTRGEWGGSSGLMVSEITAFIAELTQRFKDNETVVAVTSNGRLRYFLPLIEGEFEKRITARDFKVKTGNICELECTSKTVRLISWNKTPS